jgi:putative peptidoglycan lipid II flippase
MATTPRVDLRRATVVMALGTGLSRLSGVGRVLALAYALGFTRLADSYNLANTIPNMLYDVVLGGVLSATFIPVFVDRLATRSENDAWRAISTVITLSVVVVLGATIVFWLAAPIIIDAFTVLSHSHNASSERAVATTLLRWFVPQVALYGLIALATALLNTQRRFAAPTWVPIANNLVCITVLLAFASAVPRPSLSGAQMNSGQLLLLGLGTTLGVAAQALLLIPSLRGAQLSRLRWHWDPRHEAVRKIVHLGAWTFGFVVGNQVALFIVLALAVGAGGPAPVSAWTYAYTFLQLPSGVVAVSVMSAVTPDLAERWATSDLEAFRRRMAGGLRAMLAIIVPAAVGMLLLAHPAVALLLGHGASTPGETSETGAALAMFALGLPGFCTFLYVVRVLQSMQRTKVAFWLYLLENGLNIVLAVALVHPLGVRGLALSLSLAYSAAAVVGLWVLRRWLGHLGTPGAWVPLRGVLVSSALMAVVVLVVVNLSSAQRGIGLLVRVGAAVLAGLAVYGGVAVLLARRQEGRGRYPDVDPSMGRLAVTGLTGIVTMPPPHRGRSGLGDVRPVGGTRRVGGTRPRGAAGDRGMAEGGMGDGVADGDVLGGMGGDHEGPVVAAAPPVPGVPPDAPGPVRLVAQYREEASSRESAPSRPDAASGRVAEPPRSAPVVSEDEHRWPYDEEAGRAAARGENRTPSVTSGEGDEADAGADAGWTGMVQPVPPDERAEPAGRAEPAEPADAAGEEGEQEEDLDPGPRRLVSRWREGHGHSSRRPPRPPPAPPS